MQSVALLDVFFLEILLEVFHGDIQPAAGDDSPLVHGELVGMLDADHLVVDRQVGEVEAGDQLERIDGRLQPPFEVGQEGAEGVLAWGTMEPAHGHVDRMDRPAAQHLKDFVADLLHPQALDDDLAVIGGQADAALVAQEIGGVQQVDVQRVALDPLAAVEQSP